MQPIADLTASKLLIALVGAVAGWLLAQLTTSLRAFVDRRRAKKLLLEELNDIKAQTSRLLNFYAGQLQIHGAEGIGASASVGIANPVYDHFYRIALLSLNQDQRLSFQLIHGIVKHANEQLDQFNTLTNLLQKEFSETGASESIAKAGQRWGGSAKAAYITVGSLQWQVVYHLNNRENPSLSPKTEAHREYLQFMESLRTESEKIIESGKTIDRQRFEKIYDPDTFPPQL